MTRPPMSRYIAFATIAGFGCAADLWTKHWVFSWPDKLTGAITPVLGNYVGIQTSLNEGALFGIGQGKVGWFAAVSIIAAVAIPVWLFAFRAATDWRLTISLGAVMGGVLGNLYDRLGLYGETYGPLSDRAGQTIYAVRDWILIQANDQWRWPNFNIADALLVCGAGALFWFAWRQPNEQAANATPAPAKDAAANY